MDQYQLSILNESLEGGNKVYFIEVKVREDCLLKAARAYMVFDVLERNGEVIKSFPSVQEIEQEQFEHSFSVYYISQVDEEVLQQGISRVSEIEAVTITAVDKNSLLELGSTQAVSSQVEAAAQQTAATAPVAAVSSSTAGAEPAVSKAAAPVASSGGGAPRTIRVDIERLDSLMNLFSELLIDRVRLEQLASEVRRNDLTETVEHMSRVSADLQNIVLKLRMVPVESVFNRFPRMVEIWLSHLDKKVDLVITGAETELDRTVIDEIGDPLVHLIRNAVDHGIESIENESSWANRKQARFNLRAFHSGNHVFIEIEEDGKGSIVLKFWRRQSAVVSSQPEEAKNLTDDEVNMLILCSGLQYSGQNIGYIRSGRRP